MCVFFCSILPKAICWMSKSGEKQEQLEANPDESPVDLNDKDTFTKDGCDICPTPSVVEL